MDYFKSMRTKSNKKYSIKLSDILKKVKKINKIMRSQTYSFKGNILINNNTSKDFTKDTESIFFIQDSNDFLSPENRLETSQSILEFNHLGSSIGLKHKQEEMDNMSDFALRNIHVFNTIKFEDNTLQKGFSKCISNAVKKPSSSSKILSGGLNLNHIGPIKSKSKKIDKIESESKIDFLSKTFNSEVLANSHNNSCISLNEIPINYSFESRTSVFSPILKRKESNAIDSTKSLGNLSKFPGICLKDKESLINTENNDVQRLNDFSSVDDKYDNDNIHGESNEDDNQKTTRVINDNQDKQIEEEVKLMRIDSDVDDLFYNFKINKDKNTDLDKSDNNSRNNSLNNSLNNSIDSVKYHNFSNFNSEISLNSFTFISSINKGGYGQVDLYKMKNLNDKYAIKKVNIDFMKSKGNFDLLIKETEILLEINNVFLVKCFYIFNDEQNYYYVMDYQPGGNLRELMTDYSLKIEVNR